MGRDVTIPRFCVAKCMLIILFDGVNTAGAAIFRFAPRHISAACGAGRAIHEVSM